MQRGEICAHGNLESDHPALQECCNSKEQLLFLACLTLKTKTLFLRNAANYSPKNTASQSCILEHVLYEILLAENLKIPHMRCDGVQFDRCGCLRRNHLRLRGQPRLHTIAPQQTVTHPIPTVLPVLFNIALFLLQYLYVCL